MRQDANEPIEPEQTVADPRRFSLTADQWDAFVAALDRPQGPKPRLRRLFAEPACSRSNIPDAHHPCGFSGHGCRGYFLASSFRTWG
jgi:hypothetical protein